MGTKQQLWALCYTEREEVGILTKADIWSPTEQLPRNHRVSRGDEDTVGGKGTDARVWK